MGKMKAGRAVAGLCFGAVLVALIAACGGPQVYYGVGDVVEFGDDKSMILSSAEFDESVLEATFTIESAGTEDLSYSLWQSLQARDTNGAPQSQLVGCGSDLSGTVPPGGQATGSICWVVDTLDVVRIHNVVLLWDSSIAWEVTR